MTIFGGTPTHESHDFIIGVAGADYAAGWHALSGDCSVYTSPISRGGPRRHVSAAERLLSSQDGSASSLGCGMFYGGIGVNRRCAARGGNIYLGGSIVLSG